MLALVLAGPLGGLNNKILFECGADIKFYPGLPEFFDQAKTYAREKPEYVKHEITVEHYIVSTGIAPMVRGSAIAPHIDGVFACVGEHETSAHDESPRDACDVVEGAAFRPADNTASVAAPALCLCLHGLVATPQLIDLMPPVAGVSEIATAPPEIARTWHFATRAAPPPRAPSVSLSFA